VLILNNGENNPIFESSEDNRKIRYNIVSILFAGKEEEVLELFSYKEGIRTEDDSVEIVSLCGENNLSLLLIHEQALSEEFFSLKTGVAGTVLQKFINYKIKSCALISEEKLSKGKFREMVLESNRGRNFGAFKEREKALEWLARS